MLYRIRLEQRLDKQNAVITAIKELASEFVILTGTMYFGRTRKPIQIIEIEDDSGEELDFSSCIEKLKKALNMSTISVKKYPSPTEPKGLTAHSAFLGKDEKDQATQSSAFLGTKPESQPVQDSAPVEKDQVAQSPAPLEEEDQTSQSSAFLKEDEEDETPQSPAFLEEKNQTTQNPTSLETNINDDAPNVGAE